MSIEYECHYCHEVFPAEERIDGYENGYPVGFLCPKCGRNIQDSLTAQKKIDPSQIKWFVVLGALGLPTFIASRSDKTLNLFGIELSVFVFFLAVYVVVGLLLFIFVPSLRAGPVIITEPVEEHNQSHKPTP